MKTIIGFLTRPHGYSVLLYLIDNPNYDVIKIFTHKLKPKTEDPNRSIRNDYELFVNICKEKNILLESVDSKNTEIILPDCDYIVEVSWRYLIPKNIVNKAKILAFGIHRGKLPDYAGKEPIKQALLKGETEIVLSAHYLDSIIDQGQVLSTISHKIDYNNSKSLKDNIQKIREDITPLFPKLLFEVLKKFT
jgi:methionyl-tRNA formyltransferase